MTRKILSALCGFSLAVSFLGCRPVSTATTEAYKGAALTWNLTAGTVVELQVVSETYFKDSSTEMVRISDGKGGVKLNPNFKGKKCGLRTGAKLSFKFETSLAENPKYVVGQIVSVQDAQNMTFDALDNYCGSSLQGYLFKSDLAIVSANDASQTGSVKNPPDKIIPTPSPSPTPSPTPTLPGGSPEIVGSSTDPNGVLRDGIIYPLEDSYGSYYARNKVTTPNDSYVQDLTRRFVAIKASGQDPRVFINLKSSVVYAKDGRSRFDANFHNDIFKIGTFEAKSFQDWEGKTANYTLVPTTFQSANGAWCEQINYSGSVQRRGNDVGISCPAPMDENQISWIWIKCADLAAQTTVRCGTVAPGKFVSK